MAVRHVCRGAGGPVPSLTNQSRTNNLKTHSGCRAGSRARDRAATDHGAFESESELDSRHRPLAPTTHPFDPHDSLTAGCRELTKWCRGTIDEADLAELLVMVDSLRRGRSGNTHLCGNVSARAVVAALDRPFSAFHCQRRILMNCEVHSFREATLRRCRRSTRRRSARCAPRSAFSARSVVALPGFTTHTHP